MKVASKKNITSIIGMISIRPRRRLRGLRSFIVHPRRIEPDMVDETCPKPFHLVHDLGLAVREKIEGEERDERDEKPEGRRDERLRDTAGDAGGIDQTTLAEQLERPHHPGDRAQEAKQRRGGDDRLKYPEPALQRLLDQAGLVGRARFDPPGWMRTVVENDTEEAGEIVPLSQ